MISEQRSLRKLIRIGLRGGHQDEMDSMRASLPNFIIIGAAKSATTTLTTILPKHSEFFISKPKEPKFFGRRYYKGWPWYASLFEGGIDKAFRGEGSTMYASDLPSFENTPKLMHKHLPDLKLIYVVRHPLDRIASQWRHIRGRDPDTPDFDNLLQSRQHRKLIIGCSFYNRHLQRFRAWFPDSHIHCLTFEDLISQPKDSLIQILNFLGAQNRDVETLLDDGQLPRENEAGDKGRQFVPPPVWPTEMRRHVVEMIRPDSEGILAYMGKSSDYWEL